MNSVRLAVSDVDTTEAIITFLASANAVIFGRMIYKGVKAALAGVTRREADVLTSTLQQRDDVLARLQAAERERDMYMRQVARRDYVLLRNGLQIPDDGQDAMRGAKGQDQHDGRHSL